MVKVFLSAKLSKLLGPLPERDDPGDADDKWNGHLFSVNRRKCLIFMHKDTLYAFVLLDIVKKYLANFNPAFTNGFINQLQADFGLTEMQEQKIRNDYQQIALLRTDNDRKIIGSMNDGIIGIKYFETWGSGALKDANQYIGSRLNKTPMGAIKYDYPKDRMKARLESTVF